MEAPIDRFKKWARSEPGKKYFRAKIERFKSRRWVESQYILMCDWLADHPKKGNKKSWPKFAGGWLNRNYNKMAIEFEKSMNPATMTRADEQRQEQSQREPVRIGDILNMKSKE